HQPRREPSRPAIAHWPSVDADERLDLARRGREENLLGLVQDLIGRGRLDRADAQLRAEAEDPVTGDAGEAARRQGGRLEAPIADTEHVRSRRLAELSAPVR